MAKRIPLSDTLMTVAELQGTEGRASFQELMELSAEAELMERELASAIACDACGGSEELSGGPCICGGSGHVLDAVRYLGGRVLRLDERARHFHAMLLEIKTDPVGLRQKVETLLPYDEINALDEINARDT